MAAVSEFMYLALNVEHLSQLIITIVAELNNNYIKFINFLIVKLIEVVRIKHNYNKQCFSIYLCCIFNSLFTIHKTSRFSSFGECDSVRCRCFITYLS